MRQVMLMINPPWLIPSRAATDLAEDMPFGSLGMLPPEIYAAFVADLDRIITQICQVMPEMRREPAHQYSLFDLHMPVYTPSSGVVRQQAAEVAHAIWLRLQARDVEGINMYHLLHHYKALFWPLGLQALSPIGTLSAAQQSNEPVLHYRPLEQPSNDGPCVFPQSAMSCYTPIMKPPHQSEYGDGRPTGTRCKIG